MATTTTGVTASATSSIPSPTGTDTSDDGANGSSKSLLFFVALGFGVVFANLWIIVGVKYCFRYNARNRLRATDAESGDPIDLANMPRPRRRREKKLMSMEQVNERFPLIKYKAWRASREKEGLPAAGGLDAPASRAASIKETMLGRMSDEAAVEPEPSSPKSPLPSTFPDTSLPQQPSESASPSQDPTADPSETPTTQDAPAHDHDHDHDHDHTHTHSHTHNHEHDHEHEHEHEHVNEKAPLDVTSQTETDSNNLKSPLKDDEDEDHIQIATTVTQEELLHNPGDACAICIENLDDDDDVRGLTCGHAFHAGCLDPWLTNRRACCPLCKADYYVPKVREAPEASSSGDAANASTIAPATENTPTAAPATTSTTRLPTDPATVDTRSWAVFNTRGPFSSPFQSRAQRTPFTGSRFRVNTHDRYRIPILVRERVAAQDTTTAEQPQVETAQQPSGPDGDAETSSSPARGGFISNMAARIRPRPGQRDVARAPSATPPAASAHGPTPSELEAGIGPL